MPRNRPPTAILNPTTAADESIELVRRLKAAGLDLLDVSHGFITPDISQVPWGPGFMIPAASRIRREAAMPTVVGWMITDPHQADDMLKGQHADLWSCCAEKCCVIRTGPIMLLRNSVSTVPQSFGRFNTPEL
jgi:2,4-dienoyl-CoA reductase-like NADH-dependent reductase (Old Yellow Enzyme family)